MSRLTRAIRFARHWHARFGVLAAVFFVILVLTGVALNHTEMLALSKTQVNAKWLMRWYGIKPEPPPQGYLFEQGYFGGNEQHWVMDGKRLPVEPEPVIGAIEAGGLRYLATVSAIYLYQPDGVLVEKLTGSNLPADTLNRIGKSGNAVVVSTPGGIFSSSDGLTWQTHTQKAVVSWSQPQALPAVTAAGKAQISHLFSPGLSLERIMLDVHSGRFFGRYGPLVMDISALILMALSLSGLWIYLRSLRIRH